MQNAECKEDIHIDRFTVTGHRCRTKVATLRPSPLALRPSPFALRPSPFALRPSSFALCVAPPFVLASSSDPEFTTGAVNTHHAR
jgi:hypothetical protein